MYQMPMVMVHQMWLWVIDDRTVVSAFTERIHTDKRSLFGYIDDSIQGFSRRNQVDSEGHLLAHDRGLTKLLIRELVSRCVNFLDRPNLAGFTDPVFSSFDNEIGRVSEKVTKKYTDFRKSLDAIERNLSNSELNRPGQEDITSESELLLDIRDVRDELCMVRNVFCQQRDVLEDMDTEITDECCALSFSLYRTKLYSQGDKILASSKID
jgi:hypothetical protein